MRDDANRRIKVEGEYKLWELAACVKHHYPGENDPIQRNIEFFITLRNKIEHRFAHHLESVVAGKTQSLALNYERTVVIEFGRDASLQESLRFPVFLSSFTENAALALEEAH